MFILQCDCGNEIYGDGEDSQSAWQCEACGKWYNYFGQEVPSPLEQETIAALNSYDPDDYDD